MMSVRNGSYGLNRATFEMKGWIKGSEYPSAFIMKPDLKIPTLREVAAVTYGQW